MLMPPRYLPCAASYEHSTVLPFVRCRTLETNCYRRPPLGEWDRGGISPERSNHRHLAANEIGSQLRQPFVLIVSPPIFDGGGGMVKNER